MLSSPYRLFACLALFTALVAAGPYEVLGCYVTPATGLTAYFGTGYSFADQPDVSYDKCVARCPSTASVYAITDGYTCFCGSTAPTALTAAPAVDCRYLCSGDETEWCGGPSRADIFRKNATYVAPTTFKTSVTSARSTPTLVTNPPKGVPPSAPTSGFTTVVPQPSDNGGNSAAPPIGGTTTIPPRLTTTAPAGLTTAPPGLTTAPPGLTTAPPGLTTAPPGLTTAPPGLTTAPPGLTTAPPGLTTAPPGLTTAPPQGITTAPPVVVSTRTTTRRSRGRETSNDGNNNTRMV